MANLYPPNPLFQTQGEKNFFENLLSPLTDEWHIFYEPIINGNKPDFIVFHPTYGISIIEIKDYSKDTIKTLNPKTWEIRTNGHFKIVTSPLEQVIKYRNILMDLLGKNSNFISKTSEYMGRLKIPISTMCYFPFISEKDDVYHLIKKFIPKDMLMIKEEMNHSLDFIKKFSSSFDRLFIPEELTINEVNKLINVLYPNFEIDHTEEEVYKTSINKIIKSSSYRKFDNYVEELIFVVDTLTHWYNAEQIELDKMIIVYNKTRALLPSSKEYVQILLDLLKQRNFDFTFAPESTKSILLCTYDDFSMVESFNNKRIIFIDFNKLSYKIVKGLFIFNNKCQLDQPKFYITSCYPITS